MQARKRKLGKEDGKQEKQKYGCINNNQENMLHV